MEAGVGGAEREGGGGGGNAERVEGGGAAAAPIGSGAAAAAAALAGAVSDDVGSRAKALGFFGRVSVEVTLPLYSAPLPIFPGSIRVDLPPPEDTTEYAAVFAAL